jgi:hypothetical protein
VSSGTVHDPIADHLITQNAVLVVIVHQSSQFEGTRSMDRDRLLENTRGGVLT